MDEKLSDQAGGHLREVMEQIFKDLYTANSPYLSIYNLAKHRTGDEQQARDITMMIFQAHMWERWRKLEGLPHDLKDDPEAYRLLDEYNALDSTKFGWADDELQENNQDDE